jgi:hypothetical protein
MPIDAWRKSSSSALKNDIEVAGVTITANGVAPCEGGGTGHASSFTKRLSWSRVSGNGAGCPKRRPSLLKAGRALELGPRAHGRRCRPCAAHRMSARRAILAKVRKIPISEPDVRGRVRRSIGGGRRHCRPRFSGFYLDM